MTWEATVDTDAVRIGQGIVYEDVAIFKLEDGWYAIDNECPHQGGPLGDGTLIDDTVVACPWHGWEFDLRDGSSPSHEANVCTYETKVEDDTVYVKREEGNQCCGSDSCCSQS